MAGGIYTRIGSSLAGTAVQGAIADEAVAVAVAEYVSQSEMPATPDAH